MQTFQIKVRLRNFDPRKGLGYRGRKHRLDVRRRHRSPVVGRAVRAPLGGRLPSPTAPETGPGPSSPQRVDPVARVLTLPLQTQLYLNTHNAHYNSQKRLRYNPKVGRTRPTSYKYYKTKPCKPN
ncbi:unnamed protein product [Colias eurytheme]|nr:unnamed protein product [Colias eurytheme]